jgi:hypothetical protein
MIFGNAITQSCRLIQETGLYFNATTGSVPNGADIVNEFTDDNTGRTVYMYCGDDSVEELDFPSTPKCIICGGSVNNDDLFCSDTCRQNAESKLTCICR